MLYSAAMIVLYVKQDDGHHAQVLKIVKTKPKICKKKTKICFAVRMEWVKL